MSSNLTGQLRPALLSLLVLVVITGILYPLAVTGVAQLIFAHQANGSLLMRDGKVVGSELIGQPFDAPQYFWGRPSATAPYPYNAAASSGSNLGPLNPDLSAGVAARIQALQAADPGNNQPVPADLVTTSASGLDPDISLAAARYQVARVARVRNLDPNTVLQLVKQQAQNRQFWLLGEPRVNVLQLNLALDQLAK